MQIDRNMERAAIHLLFGRIEVGYLFWLQCLQMIRQTCSNWLLLCSSHWSSCRASCCIRLVTFGRGATYALQIDLACNQLATEIGQRETGKSYNIWIIYY